MENIRGKIAYKDKVPKRVKYTFAFGALGKDLIYGMIATFSMLYFIFLRYLSEECFLPQSCGTHLMICLWV